MEKSFKDTLNLPQTDMPMKAGLLRIEEPILEKWEKNNTYRKRLEENKNNNEFILHDGPPYPNGNIHLGHALNKILKDIVVKYHLMKGDYTPFIPGWDCHGLPIETQLLKELKKKDAQHFEIMSLEISVKNMLCDMSTFRKFNSKKWAYLVILITHI